MKKNLAIIILLLLVIFSIISCSPSEKDEHEIMKDIKSHSGFFDIQDVKIDNIDIVNRQTDEKEKTDFVYATVFGHCDDIEYELGYYLTYNLNKNKWILDSLVRDRNGVWSISKATNEQITKDIKNHSGFFDIQDVKIDNINIIKRQTDEKETTDFVYVTVFGHCDDIKYELGYYLIYNLYSNGWILDNIERDQEGVWSISTVTQNQILTDLQNDNFIKSRGLTISNRSINNYSDNVNTTSYNVSVSCDAKNEDVSFSIDYNFSYLLQKDGWEMVSSNILNQYATPLKTVSQKELDDFIATSDLNSKYDLITYVDRTTILNNNLDELTYSANKHYDNVEEIFDIKIVPEFDQQQGIWRLTKSSLIENVIIRNWSIGNENQIRTAIAQAENTPTTIITLNADIELISNFTIPSGADVTLKSSGTKMLSLISTRDMDVITIQENAKLTIENIGITRKTGTKGSGIIGARNTTVTLNSGVISGHIGTESDRSGGIDSYGTFIMNGGTIKGNTPGGFWVAGDVHIAGYFTMNGGTIGGDEGGGASNSGAFVMNNGTINGRVSTPSWNRSRDASFEMNGGTINSNVNSSLTISGGTIKGNVTTSDGLGNNSGFINMKGGEIYGNVAISRGTMDNGTIIGGVTLHGHGNNPTFTMNGGTISGSKGNGIDNIGWFNSSFVMNGGTINGHDGAGVSIRKGIRDSSFIMNDGTINGNNGGGVSIDRVGTFTMSGGTIRDNTTSGSGGGVDTSGIFNMSGGTIYNNTAGTSGGGVNQTGGTFTFDGGWIYNNRASNGNDIQIGQSGNFNNNIYDINVGAIGSPPPG